MPANWAKECPSRDKIINLGHKSEQENDGEEQNALPALGH